jgi:hypothetical protein
MSPEPLPPHDARAMHHLVGGGIASLATAILLIRDPGVPGRLAAVGWRLWGRTSTRYCFHKRTKPKTPSISVLTGHFRYQKCSSKRVFRFGGAVPEPTSMQQATIS